MATSKRSTNNAKNGDRNKGIAHYQTLLTLAKSEGDHSSAKRYEDIIKRLEALKNEEKKR